MKTYPQSRMPKGNFVETSPLELSVVEAELHEDIPPERSCGSGTLEKHIPQSGVVELPLRRNCGSGIS